MTDPKLREARIAEAKRRAEANIHNGRYDQNLASSLYDLIESDWRPEPEVDAVTLAAREWITSPANVDATYTDAFHAGHAHALANCADVRRMDWLEKQHISVSIFGVADFNYSPVSSSNPLRTKIDRAMEGGE